MIVLYAVGVHPNGVQLGSGQHNQAHAPELAVKAQDIRRCCSLGLATLLSMAAVTVMA